MLSEYAINVEWFVHSNEGTRKIYYFEIFFGHKMDFGVGNQLLK